MNREELLKNAKPILFNTEMVKAILEGRKTVTRRIVKQKYSNTHFEFRTDKYGTEFVEIQNQVEGETWGKNSNGSTWRKFIGYIIPKAPYKVGDIIYVRETWGNWSYDNPESDAVYYQYRADYPDGAKTYMLELLQDGYETIDGMIAMLYNALWSMADVREILKKYEDTGLEPEEVAELKDCVEGEEGTEGTVEDLLELMQYRKLEVEGRLLKLPCKVGDTVYKLEDYGEWQDNPHTFIPIKCQVELIFLGDDNKVYCDLVSIDDLFQVGDKFEEIPINEIYLSKEEAEKVLEE